MTTQTNIPSDLTDDDKTYVFQILDAQLNSIILTALLYGIYTGILAVTLRNIFIDKYWSIRRTPVFVIILLYTLITINFAFNWSYACSAFIENGQSFWTVYLKFDSPVQAMVWESGIVATSSTILADIYIIWCCWMVWGRRWVVALLPSLSLISATVSKIIKLYRQYFDVNAPPGIFPILYIAFVLTTTLWCTILIIYRILIVTGVKHGADSRLRVYQHFILVIIESSALYSISLLVFLAFTIRGDLGMHYLDAIAGTAKGVAPTLLIGRAAAGHTRPKDDCDELSAVSTLHFRTPSELCTTSCQEITRQSAVLETDIEAQSEPLALVSVEKA
ncbi:hypothetical protein IW261DRAFT_1563439 [Armillaria novae-zelandiae]|uniref:Uncharacterized protein n=1 Tax=Armillaria novae-zelandiae TaxID=153914 RepID=A0AA39PB34_9AGAR|nr:hypothetical protein IW261DRAFT_1563439 [Armillaria novae-zelandiae]